MREKVEVEKYVLMEGGGCERNVVTTTGRINGGRGVTVYVYHTRDRCNACLQFPAIILASLQGAEYEQNPIALKAAASICVAVIASRQASRAPMKRVTR